MWSKSLTFQFLVVMEGRNTGLQGFRPGQSSSSSSHRPAGIPEDLDEPGEGVFRTFPSWDKKCACRRESECGAAPGGQAHRLRRLMMLVIAGLLDASSYCPVLLQGAASSTLTRWAEFGDASPSRGRGTSPKALQ